MQLFLLLLFVDFLGHVISNGSFAKIIAPGLRMGWYEAPQRIINHFRDTYLGESGGGQTAYLSRVVAEALRSELIDEHVNNLRVAHKVSDVLLLVLTLWLMIEELASHTITIEY